MTERRCPECGDKVINWGAHFERCYGPNVQVELAPEARVDPSSQVTRTPGLDAVCEQGLTADTCRWPYCTCLYPDRKEPE